MDYLEEKFEDFQKALNAFSEILSVEKNTINRDAALKRFEFTFELFWKVIKLYLKEKEGIDCHSPKGCIREVRLPLDLKEEDIEKCISMVEDRNLSVHIYSEEMADEMYEKLPGYCDAMKLIAEKIKEK